MQLNGRTFFRPPGNTYISDLLQIKTAQQQIENGLMQIEIHPRTQCRLAAGWSQFVAGRKNIQWR